MRLKEFTFLIPLTILLWMLLLKYKNGVSEKYAKQNDQPKVAIDVGLGAVLPTIKLLPQFKRRTDLALFMHQMGAKMAIEIGVQRGLFAEAIITNWNSIEKYYGIDPWVHQIENYKTGINFNNSTHNTYFEESKKRLERFGSRVELIREFSNNAVSRFRDNSIDFIYVDGRHDYCGCYEDMDLYYNKIKPGGIIAGHDYMKPLVYKDGSIDWRICANGSMVDGGVIKAVQDFTEKHKINEIRVIHEPGQNPTFYFQKP